VEKAKPILQEIEDIEEAEELETPIVKSIFREADRFKVLDVM